jgi:hypothetical protein
MKKDSLDSPFSPTPEVSLSLNSLELSQLSTLELSLKLSNTISNSQTLSSLSLSLELSQQLTRFSLFPSLQVRTTSKF